AFAHQDVPFEKLVQEIQPERSLAHTPLFQVMVMLVNVPTARFELPGLVITPEPAAGGTVKFDLNLALTEDGGGLTGALAYNSDLFDATTAARLAGHLEVLLRGAVAAPGVRLADLPLLTAAERHQTLREWTDTREDPAAGPATLHGLFFAQAERTPDAPAVLCGDTVLTYRELAAQALRLARRLRARGVGPEVRVAVRLERGPGMVVALLGILAAGGAYVPLSGAFPEERVRGIVEGLEIGVVVTEADVEAKDGKDFKDGKDEEYLLPSPHLAYVIFTSGSTGVPKGVEVPHAPAVHLVNWVVRTFGFGPADRVLFVTELSFDLSVFDVFGLLAAGGSVRIATAAEVRDPAHLAHVLQNEPITFWDSAPASLLQVVPFLPETPVPGARLRLVFQSGDWIPVGLPDRVRQAFPQAEVVSLGGATEATVWSNVHRIREVPAHWTSIPYGRPIANARYHVLTAGFRACPIGVAGDLYIAGTCLSAGYARDPVLTASKFVPSPWAVEPGERLYRTGDRARHWADGTLEFLGRSDTQVKVRGFRIELGEIETALAAHPGVREAVVLVRGTTPLDQRLVAFVIPADGAAPTLPEVRRFLAPRLPDYMLPSDLVPCSAWPATATGKLDRRALLAQTRQTTPPAVPSAAVAPAEPPRTALEKTLTEIWRELTGRAEVGLRDNFFDLGGHSLLMVEMQARLRARTRHDVAIVDLFRFPTIASLAEHLEGSAPAPRPSGLPAPAPVPAAGPAIAIVGLVGRFPGAPDLEELWRNLCAGVESISFFSAEELAAAGVDPAQLADPAYVPARGILPGADLFDAAFFDCPPREAEILDPQQRIFLELAWEALESAGYVPEKMPGRIGVYAGLSENTYVQGLYGDAALVRSVGLYQLALANKPEYLPTRVSYKLGLTGPSVNVQTACSTSLVAVHMACRALLAGECEMALAGGVSIRFPQTAGYRWEEGSIASPDGHVRAFDAAAGGTVAGSGAGVVVLKRLEDALAARDSIRAVVLGSAINNDGSSKAGFAAPSVDGQAEVVRQAHRAAGVDPATIAYVEAHGTGTAVGDPIEVAGLAQAFCDACELGPCRMEPVPSSPLPVFPGTVVLGSIKTNLGHLDAAAGIASLAKAVLCLEHRAIPPTLHFSAPNPRIDFARTPFRVNAALTPWPDGETPRRAGVSSFGIGGTNAHAVLEEAPPPLPGGPSRPAQLLVLSARSAAAAAAMQERLAGHLERHPEIDLADAAYTLQVGRRELGWRRMLVAAGREEALQALRSARSKVAVEVAAAAAPSTPRPVVFLFPGQGAQRPGMGSGLWAAEPVYREALDHACEILAAELGQDLRALLGRAAEGSAEAAHLLEGTALAQPALFALEHALARLLLSWGIRPHALLGHSLGEYVAACLAGVFTLEEGARLVALRGRLMAARPPGCMVTVALSEDEVESRLAGHPGLALAAAGAPRVSTLSGPPEAMARLVGDLEREGIEHRLLRTSHAFHSPMMQPVAEPFAAALSRVDLRPPELPFLSNVTGTWITAEEATDPEYWVRHLLSPVRFGDGVATLTRATDALLLEVGPGRALSTLVHGHPAAAGRPAFATLGAAKSGDGEPAALLTAVGRLWLHGAAVDFAAFQSRERRRRVPLPPYPFERHSYWRGGRLITPASLAAAPPAAARREPTGEVPALSGIEQGVATVFEELLGVAGVGAGDDFFDLGG
ncbi:MAG TPA: non-ribosomal peptide synthetase, partial [Acidobacteria bacterium]|nr:non-ribosomal peptide synthetase [Acidobacteriota bacterium]